MSPESRRAAGILLVVLPTVIFGGVSILSFLISPESGYMNNPLRQNLWRAGHAHAGVFLILARGIEYVDEAVLSNGTKLCALGVAGGSYFHPSHFLVSNVSDRNQAERIDLSGICRRGSPGSWAGDARCGPNTKVKQTNL